MIANSRRAGRTLSGRGPNLDSIGRVNETERLHTAVQDERAQRHWAEQELAKESAKASLWRRRAEERFARIVNLEDRLSSQPNASATPGTLLGRVRGAAGSIRSRLQRRPSASMAELPSADSEPFPNAVQPTRRRSTATPVHGTAHPACRAAFPFVRVAVLGGEGLPFLNEFETISMLENRDSLHNAEAVFVTLSALSGAPNGVAEGIADWMALPARQPIAVWVYAVAAA
jgi:hypothetical protein